MTEIIEEFLHQIGKQLTGLRKPFFIDTADPSKRSPQDIVRSQTITFAGDADQGDQGRWAKAKVEQWSKETGIPVRYIIC